MPIHRMMSSPMAIAMRGWSTSFMRVLVYHEVEPSAFFGADEVCGHVFSGNVSAICAKRSLIESVDGVGAYPFHGSSPRREGRSCWVGSSPQGRVRALGGRRCRWG